VALRRSLGKDADGPVSRWLNRPLSTRLSMVLAPLRPAPDLVSLVAFTFGLAGAALLAAGQGPAGGLLVHASSVADGVDGRWLGCSRGEGRGGRCLMRPASGANCDVDKPPGGCAAAP
jgi:hypothetical protein